MGRFRENNIRIYAFTLAEVLITLGIIGVVAALTIPVLMQNIQDRQFKEAAKAAYSKASQAVQQMKMDEGGNLAGYYGSTGMFKPKFMKYFKVAQDCNLNDCVPDVSGKTSNVYATLINEKASTAFMGNGQFITNDGMLWMIGDFYAGGIFISVDVNGQGKRPNKYGRDVFMFEVVNDVLIPSGSANSYFNLNNYPYCSTSANDQMEGLGCMEYVMQGKDY